MSSTEGATPHTNARQAELNKFGALASRWWDSHGPQKPLHAMNPVRLRYVSDHAYLSGAQVADIGCGGGLLSETMARAGANVTAIDLAPELIEVAKLHALETGVQVDYRITSAEALALAQPAAFDVVTCMELIEHVPDPQSVLEACAALLKPGGALFVSTLNRTPAAFGLAIVGAEYIARLLPRGTHQYRDFIRPAELARGMREAGLQPGDASGILYEPWRNTARLWPRMDVNYVMMAKKPA